ncbi:MAG: hypothetical protein KC457_07125 [Myxococcales bacterium]|nr:hypothetical protein [Myxococcales bacterium]
MACPADPEPEEGWAVVQNDLPGALFAVWGTSAADVWAVGADTLDGSGPTVLHFDGQQWSRELSGQAQGDLWWVFGFEGGPVYMGGAGGLILRYQDGSFTPMTTPGNGTVFGIWGASPSDVWAVGGESDASGGFAWRLSGDTWEPEASLPADLVADAAIWKIYGASAGDAWLVGSNGVSLHWDGATLSPGDTGVGTSLFTVHHAEGRYVAVGGSATGFIVENDGSGWSFSEPDPPSPGLSGVTLGTDGFGVAVGLFGAIYTRSDAGWAEEPVGFPIAANLHGSWIDETGGVWVVGGQTLSPPFDEGILLHRGATISADGLEY